MTYASSNGTLSALVPALTFAFVMTVILPPQAIAQEGADPRFEETEIAERTERNKQTEPSSVFDENWLTVGLGVGVLPSYNGSDDYVALPAPLVQGSIAGIDINARPAGLALDLIPDQGNELQFALGPTARFRFDRTDRIEDEVVELAGELDTAFEIGAAAGVSYSGLLNPYDTLSLNADIRWDVAGAHDGMMIQPAVSYRTPLNQGTLAILIVNSTYVDDDYADYYHSVNVEQAAASGLPLFDAEGGFTSVGANALVGFDLDGNLQNGGLALFVGGGYSRQLNDAKDTPFTSIRGSADQFLGFAGLAFTF